MRCVERGGGECSARTAAVGVGWGFDAVTPAQALPRISASRTHQVDDEVALSGVCGCGCGWVEGGWKGQEAVYML